MFRGVADLNVNYLGNWGFLLGNSYHVFRPICVYTTHGAFTPHATDGIFGGLGLHPLSSGGIFPPVMESMQNRGRHLGPVIWLAYEVTENGCFPIGLDT